MRKILFLLGLLLFIPESAKAQSTISWGVSVNSINAATSTATGTSYALISTPASVLTWTIDTTGTVTSQTVLLEGSLDNSVWFTLDSSTSITDVARTITTSVKFIRARISAHGGGGGTTSVDIVSKGSPWTANFFTGGTVTSNINMVNGSAIRFDNTLALPADGLITFPNSKYIYWANSAGTAYNGSITYRSNNYIEIAGDQGINLPIGPIRIGTNPAQAGIFRIPNNSAISARNAANTADITLISLDASNIVQIAPSNGYAIGGNGTFGGSIGGAGPIFTTVDFRVTSDAGKYEYADGSGGVVTQLTSKTTGVTINKPTGQVTFNNAALAAGAEACATVTNSKVEATDVIMYAHASGGTAGAYFPYTGAVAAGSFSLCISNVTPGSLSEAPVITFAILRGAGS